MTKMEPPTEAAARPCTGAQERMMALLFGCCDRLISRHRPAVMSASLFALAALAPTAHAAEIEVTLDQAKLVRLPEKVATIIIGNPLIADAAVQAGGVMVITGKGYGYTNLVALDRAGKVLLDDKILVQGPNLDTVVVYRGVERETYSCTPMCERRITLGDSTAYFDASINQIGSRTDKALGVVPSSR